MLQITDLTDKYSTSTRAADAGAVDGGNNWPPQDAKGMSKTERDIVDMAQGELNDQAATQKQKNDSGLARVRQLEGGLTYDVRYLAEQFTPLAETKIVEVDRLLVRLYRDVLDRERDYRRFKSLHRLNREAEPAPSLYVALAWLSLAMVLDGGLNAYFFKDVGPLGLVGGFLIAFVISACNIALGFSCGWGPARFFGHRHKLHLLWAVLLFVALIGTIVAFNLGAAHYRDLIIHSPDIEVSGVIEDLYKNAGRIPSMQACLMAIVGIGVAAFAAIKGYAMLDAYPGYGAVYKRMRAAQDDLEAEITAIRDRINAEMTKFLRSAGDAYHEANQALQQVLDRYDRLLSGNEQYEMNVDGIEGACRNTLEVYREQNLRVRNTPPPAHFFEKVSLVRAKAIFDGDRVAKAKADLKARQDTLRTAAEKLEREVPALAARILSEGSLKHRIEEIIREAEQQNDRELEARKETDREDDTDPR